jgi:NAD(P)-dependent dehydrogenase (short-subunit alcohol dehydrogenase family)
LTRFRLDGAVAIVTGGFGRLGPVWAGALLDAGATVFALDLPHAEPSGAFTALCERTADGRLELLRADVRDRASLEAALAECVRRVGPPSVLVNNAGIDQPPEVTASARLEDASASDFQTVLGVNVVGTFQATQVFGAAMFAGGGSIINIGSMYGSVSPDARMYDHLPMDPPFIKPPAYGPSKAAVVNLTRYFATHWAAHGIRVNTLSPGGVSGNQDAAFVEKFTSRVPLGRMAGPEDLVGPLVFLASDASAYVTGIDLKVDGGFTAW